MKKENNWFEFAQEDLKVARISLKEGIFNQVCFHSHQGIEKMLKGFLRSKDKFLPKTHSLPDLLTLCAEIDNSFEKFRQNIVKFDEYYIPTRYPDALMGISPEGLPNEQNAKEILSFLKEIMEFIKKKV